MTRDERDELRRLVGAATPGPWTAFDTGILSGPRWVVGNVERPFERMEDAAFIAAARTAVPSLLDEVERLEAERDTSARYTQIAESNEREAGIEWTEAHRKQRQRAEEAEAKVLDLEKRLATANYYRGLAEAEVAELRLTLGQEPDPPPGYTVSGDDDTGW